MIRIPLHVAVDGQGLARPAAGIGVYTQEMVAALRQSAEDSLITLWVAPSNAVGGSGTRTIPRARFLGRHVIWPRRLAHSGANLFWGAAGQLPLGRMAIPSVVTVHDLAIYRQPSWFPRGQTLSVKLVVPRSLRRAQRLIAVSASTASDVVELFGIDRGRIDVVHEGVGAAFRPLRREQLQSVAQRYELPEHFLLFVGTIEPRKNLLTLLQAWSQMRHRPPLVIAGGRGWRDEKIERHLERAGSLVRPLGAVPREDLPALYNLATCLTHPAWYEGFGLTVLEAMACGTPVVAANASSLPEVGGTAVRLVPPGDVQAWTGALEEVCGDPQLQQRMREGGLLRAAEFSWSRSADRTLRIFRQLVRAAQ